MARNASENIPIVLFCFDFCKQMCVILLPVGCSHDMTNLPHKRLHQSSDTLFSVGDWSSHDCTYLSIILVYNNRYYNEYRDDKLTISRAENSE